VLHSVSGNASHIEKAVRGLKGETRELAVWSSETGEKSRLPVLQEIHHHVITLGFGVDEKLYAVSPIFDLVLSRLDFIRSQN